MKSKSKREIVHRLARPSEVGCVQFATIVKDEDCRVEQFEVRWYETAEEAEREARIAIDEGAIDAYVVRVLLQDVAEEVPS